MNDSLDYWRTRKRRVTPSRTERQWFLEQRSTMCRPQYLWQSWYLWQLHRHFTCIRGCCYKTTVVMNAVMRAMNQQMKCFRCNESCDENMIIIKSTGTCNCSAIDIPSANHFSSPCVSIYSSQSVDVLLSFCSHHLRQVIKKLLSHFFANSALIDSSWLNQQQIYGGC